MITDEMVHRAMRIAQGATPVCAGDGNTYIVSPPTMRSTRAALEAVLPMIRAEVLEEAAMVAESEAASRAQRLLDNDAHWSPIYRERISAAIRAMKGTSHD